MAQRDGIVNWRGYTIEKSGDSIIFYDGIIAIAQYWYYTIAQAKKLFLNK